MSPQDIVRALAAADPIQHSEDPDAFAHWCVLCDTSNPVDARDHEPDCPWRLAVEWCEE
jgi:hypothetical protein